MNYQELSHHGWFEKAADLALFQLIATATAILKL